MLENNNNIKFCKSCLLKKPLNEFYKHKTTRDKLHPKCKSCIAIVEKDYRNKNKEIIKIRKDKCYARNGEKYKITVEKWRQRNIEKDLIMKRNYYLNNKENCVKNNKNWEINNRHKRKALTSNNRAKKIGVYGIITPNEILELYVFQESKCAYCKKDLINYQIDHVIPLSKGGVNLISNIKITCFSCNAKKHTSSMDYFLKKLNTT